MLAPVSSLGTSTDARLTPSRTACRSFCANPSRGFQVEGQDPDRMADTEAPSMLRMPGMSDFASAWPIAKQLAFIALFLFAWGESWHEIYVKTRALIASGSNDVKFTAPLLILLTGLIATNILGFVAFKKDGQLLEAGLAVVDLDSPYVVGTRCGKIIRGETVSESG